MDELHIGIKFEPWGGGAHISALKGPPDSDLNLPHTLLPSDTLAIPVYLWWLDNEVPDEATRRDIEQVVRSYVERDTRQRPESAAGPTTEAEPYKEHRNGNEEE